MKKNKPHILLTNDDGIRSPGLWAAASELSKIGYVTVAAPREQSTGMGRSLPSTSDGVIRKEQVQVNGQEWSVYAIGGTPAQAVLHGVLEIVPHKPDLIVSLITARMSGWESPSRGRSAQQWKPPRWDSPHWQFHFKPSLSFISPIQTKSILQ